MRNDFSEIIIVNTGINTVCMVNLKPQACLLVGAFVFFPLHEIIFSVFMQTLFPFHVAWFHVPLVSLRVQALNKTQTLE